MKTILPQPFKLVGYALPILFLAIIAVLKFASPELLTPFKGRSEVFFSVLNVGLLTVILSHDKFEDERTQKSRLDAITFAFLFGTFHVLFHSLGIWTSAEVANSSYVMGLMLGVYLISFEMKKRFGI